jgi:predicted nucleic acid-binding protein
MDEGLLYLDSSALVKLIVPEAESRALREALRPWPERVSSVVAEIEVEQVARCVGSGAIRRARSVLPASRSSSWTPRSAEWPQR